MNDLAVQPLGDAGVQNDDNTYTGDVSDSAFSMDYVRQKFGEFQVLLDALALSQNAARQTIDDDVSPELTTDMQSFLADIDSRRTELRVTSEAVNAISATYNALGGRLPSVSYPATLGFAQLIPMAAVLGVVGTIGSLAYWGSKIIEGVNARLLWAAQTAGLSPQQRASLVLAQQKSAAALEASRGSIWSKVGNVAKWAALAGLAWVGFLAFKAYKRGRH